MRILRSGFLLVIIAEIIGWLTVPALASDFTWFGLIVTAAFVWGTMEFFDLPVAVWELALFAVIIDGLSALFLLYSRIDSWDRWIHAFGGIVIAAGALHLVRQGLRKGHVSAIKHRPFILASTYLIVAAIGFLYEFWEYIVDHLQYGYPKSLVNAYDSVEDQVFNLLGATLVLLVYMAWDKRKNKV